MLTDSARETLEGDRLFAADTEVPLNFILSTPPENLQGRIISVVDGVELIGQYQVVVINRGTRHGVVPGNVLAIDQAGEVVRDRGGKPRLRLRNGSFGARRCSCRTSARARCSCSRLRPHELRPRRRRLQRIHVADVVRNP